MNHLVFNGKDFSEFSAQVTKSSFLKGAERDGKYFDVLGRSGSLFSDNSRYKTVTLQTQLAIKGNMQNNMEAMRRFLSSCVGFCRYEESDTPQEYRLASFSKEFNPSDYDHLNGVVTLQFVAQPQRYLKAGEIPVSFNADGQIFNPTYQNAKPLIRIYGNGSFEIGNITVTVAEHTQAYIDIDCESMLIYSVATRMSEYITMTNHEFPEFRPGLNGITVDGVTLQITPRWFEV